MSGYRGVELDFGAYNWPQNRVEFDLVASQGSRSGCATTTPRTTFKPAAHVTPRFRKRDKKSTSVGKKRKK